MGPARVNEVLRNPVHVLEQVAVGSGIAAGVALLAPEIAIGLAGAAAGAAAYGLYEHSGKWFHSAAKVAGWEQSSSDELKSAHNDLENLGAGSVDLAAGLIGGGLGVRAISRIAKQALPMPEEPTPPSPLPPFKIALDEPKPQEIRPILQNPEINTPGRPPQSPLPELKIALPEPTADVTTPSVSTIRQLKPSSDSTPPPSQTQAGNSLVNEKSAPDKSNYGLNQNNRKDLDPVRMDHVKYFSEKVRELFPDNPEARAAAYRYAMHKARVDNYASSIMRDTYFLERVKPGSIRMLDLIVSR